MSPDREEHGAGGAHRPCHYRRPVVPYISSTLEDFERERNLLVTKVFPAVDAICRQRGTYCAPVDLRWSPNSAQARSGDLLRLCLDYVSRSCPFSVCLLGERYGACRPENAPPLPASIEQLPPNANWLDRNLLVAASSGYDWVTQEAFRCHSVTELEIVLAVQLAEAEHAFFYFRQPDHVDELLAHLPEEERQEQLAKYEAESEYSRRKVRELKGRIVKKGLPVKYFRSAEQLAQLVLDDWMALIDRIYPPIDADVIDVSSERFLEWMSHEAYGETRRRSFVRSVETESIFSELTAFCEECLEPPPTQDEYAGEGETFRQSRKKRKQEEITKEGVLALVGDRGTGKTAIVANWAREFADGHPQIHVITHFVGSSALSTDPGALMRHCIQDLMGDHMAGSASAASEDGEQTGLYHLTETFRAGLAMQPCVLIIDGIDELCGSYGMSPQQMKELSWLPLPLPPQCRVIVTTLKSDLTFRHLSQRPDVRMRVVPSIADLDARREILEEHLSIHYKKLTPDQLDRIVQCKLSDRPLFLSVLASELRVFCEHRHFDSQLDSYLDVSSMRELWSRIMQRWMSEYGWNVPHPLGTSKEDEVVNKGNTGWVADALRQIAVSRNGLSQAEILSILKDLGYTGDQKVTSFDWAQFRSVAQDALFEKPGGFLDFFHHHLKEAVEYTLLGAVTPDLAKNRDPQAKNGLSTGGKFGNFAAILSSPFAETPRSDPCQRGFHQQLAFHFHTCPPGTRRSSELPWQLEMCGNMEQLKKVLGEPQLFLELCDDKKTHHSSRLDLMHYWKILEAAGYNARETYNALAERVTTKQPNLPQITINDEDRQSENSKGAAGGEAENSPTSSMETISDVHAPLNGEVMNEHQQARLCRSLGLLLQELGYVDDAHSLLLMAYAKLYENYPLGNSAQLLLYEVEEALGSLYHSQQDIAAAQKWYNKALNSMETLMEGLLDDRLVRRYTETKGTLLDRLGYILVMEHEHSQAEKMLKQAEKHMTQASSLIGKATVQYHMGVLRLNRGQYVEAEMLFRQAITTREHWFGKSHPLVAEVLNHLANLLCHPENQISHERYEAEALYRRALYIREQCLGCDHPLVATTLFHLGKLLQDKSTSGLRSECIQLLRRSLDIRTTKLGADHHMTRSVRRLLGSVESEMTKPRHPQVESRPACQQRYSRMTWHDTELLLFQQRDRKKTADAARVKAMTQRAVSHEDDSPRQGHLYQAPSLAQGRSSQGMLTATQGGSRTGSVRSGGGTSMESFIDNTDVFADESASNAVASTAPVDPQEAEEQQEEGTLKDAAQEDAAEVSVDVDDPKPVTARRSKPRPRSSYGKREATSVSCVQFHPALKSPARPVSSTASSDYIDSYCRSPLVISARPEPIPKPTQARLVLRIGRPRTDPNKLYKRYGGSVGSVTNSSDPASSPEPSRGYSQRLTARPQLGSTQTVSVLRAPSSGAGATAAAPTGPRSLPAGLRNVSVSGAVRVHRQHCYLPGPHTNDLHNTYSPTKGPNTSLVSLLGDPPAPRDVFLQVRHTSAWYHVPGRYPITDRPYPPKRSQQRVSLAERQSSWPSGFADGSTAAKMERPVSQRSWCSRNSLLGGLEGESARQGSNMVRSWMG